MIKHPKGKVTPALSGFGAGSNAGLIIVGFGLGYCKYSGKYVGYCGTEENKRNKRRGSI